MQGHIPQVLVVYGVRARIPLSTARGYPIGKVFELTASNQKSFEPALRQALSVFMKDDAVIQGARFVFIRNAADFSVAVHSGSYTQVIYYGHALEGENALLPTPHNRIHVGQLAHAIYGTAVTHLDILGCASASIAAAVSGLVAGVQVGYLRTKRVDDVVCEPSTMKVLRMAIQPQPVLHFGNVRP